MPKFTVYLGASIFAKMIFSPIMVVSVGILLPNILGYGAQKNHLVLVFVISVVLIGIRRSFTAVFQAMEKMFFTGAVEIIWSLIFVGGVICAVLLKEGIEFFAYSHLFGSIVSLIISIVLSTRYATPKLHIRYIKDVIIYSLPFGFGALFWSFYQQAGIVMLSTIATDTEVGVFSAAFKLVAIPGFVPYIIILVFHPALFRLGAKNSQEHFDAIRRTLKYMGAFGFITSILSFVFAEKIIHLIFGEGYSDSAIALRLLCWVLSLQCLNAVLGSVLTTRDRQRLRTVIQGIALSINVGLNLLIIPRFGHRGAAVAMLFTEFFILLSYTVSTRHIGYPMTTALLRLGAFLFIAGGIGLFAVYVSSILGLHFLLSIVLSMTLYLIILGMLGLFTLGDLRFFLSLTKERESVE